MKRICLSFASRLTLYMLSLTTLIFLCIAIVFHRYSRLREERQAVDYTSVLQEKLIQRVDFELAEIEETVRGEVYRVRRVKDNPDEMMPIVTGMVRRDSLIMGGSLAFVHNYYVEKGDGFMEYAYMEEMEDGKEQLIAKHLGNSSYDYLNKPWFTQTIAQRKGIWSEPYFDKGGANKMMITYSYPIMDDENQVFAVITADVSLEDLAFNMFSIRPYADSYSFIISHKGTYISHPNKKVILRQNIFSRGKELDNAELIAYAKKMIAGEKGSFRSHIEGVDVLACYAPLPRTGWSICSICPYRTVMAQLGSTFGVLALILLLGFGLLILCIRMLVKFTVKPIKELTEATKQIASGNLNTKLPEIHTHDDLGVLHDSFENMQKSLLAQMNELQNTTRQRERMESELNIAHAIQMNIVPKKFSPFPETESLELYALLKPAKEVGGDLYDFFIKDDHLFFCIGDVSGKGIPASLVMAITSTMFRMIAHSFNEPNVIVGKLNDTISNNNETNMFVTMFVGVLDLKSGSLSFCSAGHNPPLVISKQGTAEYLKVKPNLPVGVMQGMKYTNQQIVLQHNQALLLYTDGLTEAENSDKELFGEQRVLKSSMEYASSPVKEIVEKIQKSLTHFVDGAEQSDDLTMLCIRLNQKQEVMEKKAGNEFVRELIINNVLEESQELAPFVEAIGDTLHLGSSMVSALNLALEEALVNVIQYAYPKGVNGPITLRAHWTTNHDSLTFELMDMGKPFDPTQVKEADVTLGVEERPIGGLGVFLVRKIMDQVSYHRESGMNVLVMTKKIQSKGEA